jgi:glycogen(starch) synthase
LKILFLSEGHPPHVPHGIGSSVSNWARALAARGHEVHVLDCIPWYRPRDKRNDGIVVHQRRILRVRGARRLQRLLPREIRRSLRRRTSDPRRDRILRRLNVAASYYLEYKRLKTEFDVIHAPDGYWGLFFALRSSVPLIVTLRTPAVFNLLLESDQLTWRTTIAAFIDHISTQRATLLIGPSEFQIQVLKARGWLDSRSEPVVIPNTIDIDAWLSISPVQRSGPTILCLGRQETMKAPEILVRAAALLAPQIVGLDVLIAGSSVGRVNGQSYRESLVREVRMLGAPCRIIDHVSYPEAVSLYGAARVVAIPSRHEAFSMVALEAMAAGRPVVCTSRVGVAELIEKSGSGTVVPVDDPEALANAMKPYLEDPELAARAGERGRMLIKTRLAPGEIAAQLEKASLEALQRWRASRGL